MRKMQNLVIACTEEKPTGNQYLATIRGAPE